MKVLICIPCLLTGGTEVQTLSLVKALVEAGHKVVTVCYFEHDGRMMERYGMAGSEVVCLSPEGRRPQGVKATFLCLHSGLRRVVRSVRPDVAHVQYMAPGAMPIVLLRLLGVKKVVATAHTAADIYPSLKLLRWIRRHLLVAFTCITERAERSFFGSSSLFGSETVLFRKGNHFTIYDNLPDYIHLARCRRKSLGSFTIGVVSRLERIKGMDLVVTAFVGVHKVRPDTRLLVAGDGSLRTLMARQATEAGLDGCVDFIGRQPQERLQDCYDKIDILLMPSRSEGFGLTAIEGMARGCVVVAADVGGLPEVVLDGKTGLLHRREDADDIAGKVLSLVQEPPLWENMSASAVQRAALFGSDRYGRLIERLYRQIAR